MMLKTITVALLCLFGNAAVLAEDGNFLDFIDVQPYLDNAEQSYDTFISKLTTLDENVKTLADQLGQPDEGLRELDDQLAILIDKLSTYRDLLIREVTDSANFRVATAIFYSQEFRDVVTSEITVGQKLIELGDTWDVTTIDSLPGIADFLASLLDVQLHLQEMVASSEEFRFRIDMLKTLPWEDDGEILRNINNMIDAANQMIEAFITFYNGLESVQFAIEWQH